MLPLHALVMCLDMLKSVISVLYPPACLLCQRWIAMSSELFCELCRRSMDPLLPPVCQQCGVGLSGAYDAQSVCRRCQEQPPAFAQARAPFVYRGRVREAIHAFKYRGRHRIGLWLADKMVRTAETELPLSRISRILAVPMHWTRQRLKGDNPAAFLACAVAKTLQFPCQLDIVRRTRWTRSQTRLTLSQRVRNVAGAFEVRRPPAGDEAVLLIDDVLTSGATVNACAQVLRTAGVKEIFVLTAACTPPG